MLRLILVLALIMVGCGNDPAGDGSGRPTIVVTTSVLGDVVANVAGDLADVTVIIPAGADPHEFQPSARQAQTVEDADLLVLNGLGFEEGLDDVIDAAVDGGVPAVDLSDAIEPRGDDPHWFNDPLAMAAAVDLLADRLASDLPDGDADDLLRRADEYRASIEELHSDVVDILSAVPDEDRKLVTNHESFGYFADRYDFEYIGAVIPNLSTGAEPSAAGLRDLAALIEAEDVPAIFGEVSQSNDLADALAAEVGHDVDVVTLHSESLGDDGSGAETYLDMQRTNAELIAGALA